MTIGRDGRPIAAGMDLHTPQQRKNLAARHGFVHPGSRCRLTRDPISSRDIDQLSESDYNTGWDEVGNQAPSENSVVVPATILAG